MPKKSVSQQKNMHPRAHAAALNLLRTMAVVAGTFCLAVPVVHAQSDTAACQSDIGCWSAPELGVLVRSLSTSQHGGYHYVTVSVRLFNRTSEPFALAYIHNDLNVTDNRGNRFSRSGKVSGMPAFQNARTPADFRIMPGESRDATFEFALYAPQAVVGDQFEVSLSIRELRMIGDTNRVEPGAEHAVSLPALREGIMTGSIAGGTSGRSVAGSTRDAAPNKRAMPAQMPKVDPCKALPACAVDGVLQIQVVRIESSTLMSEDSGFDDPQMAVVYLKIKNLDEKPVSLAHQLGASRLVDDEGNKYAEKAPTDLSKDGFLPFVTKKGVSRDLTLQPGATRNVALLHILENSSKLKLSDKFRYEIDVSDVDPQEKSISRDFTVKYASVNGKVQVEKRKSGFEKYQDSEMKEFEKFKSR